MNEIVFKNFRYLQHMQTKHLSKLSFREAFKKIMANFLMFECIEKYFFICSVK